MGEVQDYPNPSVDPPFTALIHRICVGRCMANNWIFINVATVLWAANIVALKDEAGKPIIPNTLETVNAGVVVLVSSLISFYHPDR